MASLYRRARSPFHWISFLDPATGKRMQRSTHLRADSVAESRRACDLARDYSAAEQRADELPEAWEHWVPRFLEQRYGTTSATAARYAIAWTNVRAFLAARKIDIPRQLTRNAVRDYVGWRAQPHPDTYAAGKSTALLEIKLLGLVMREAQQSGFATLNPCERLGIGRDASPRKPAVTQSEYARIVKELESRPEWMRVGFAICWFQGCRWSESHIHLPTQLNLDNRTIYFRTKGHKQALSQFPLASQLIPMFTRMIAEKKEWSFDMPSGSRAGSKWWRFFREIGLPHLCIHACRVSFVTICLMAGLTREQTMRLTDHSNYSTHLVYARLTADHDSVQATRQLLDAASGYAVSIA